MRLSFRILLASLRAIECGMDELSNELRNTQYKENAIRAGKSLRVARIEISALLDRMIDDNYGDSK